MIFIQQQADSRPTFRPNQVLRWIYAYSVAFGVFEMTVPCFVSCGLRLVLLLGSAASPNAMGADWVKLPPVARVASLRPISESNAQESGAEEVTWSRPVDELFGEQPLPSEPFEFVDPPMPSDAARFAMVPPTDHLAALSLPAQQFFDDGTAEYEDLSSWAMFRDRFGHDIYCDWQCIQQDYRNYYSRDGLRYMVVGFGLGAAVANTNADHEIQKWWQEDVRTGSTDDFARWVKTFGDGRYLIPVAMSGWLAGEVFYQQPIPGVVGEWGGRTMRSMFVGGPPMLLMQSVTGASRPGESPASSSWQPFHDANGVSGHAFMGALPFINAAKMSDDIPLKAGFYACSLATAWSRLNDDAHFTSQAFLGWGMAYWAATAVDITNCNEPSNWSVEPMVFGNGTGVGVVYTY
jgi:hypothetical protein